jgi:hypothetical protein
MNSPSFPLTPDIKREMLRRFWGFHVPAEDEKWALDNPYFDAYQSFIKSSKVCNITSTHDKIMEIVDILSSASTKAEIQHKLKDKLPNKVSLSEADEIIKRAINLATRLLLMMSTGPFASGRIEITGETKLSK